MSSYTSSSSPSNSTENTIDMDSDTFTFENDPVVQVMNLLNFSVVCRTDDDKKSKEIDSLKLSLESEKYQRQATQQKFEALSQFTSQLYNEIANIFQRITSMTRKNRKFVSRGNKRRQRHILEIGPFQGHFEAKQVYCKLKSLAEIFQEEPCTLNDIESLQNTNKFLADCLVNTNKLHERYNGKKPPVSSAPPTQIKPSDKAKEIEIIQLDQIESRIPENLEDSERNLNLPLATLRASSQQVSTEHNNEQFNGSLSHHYAEDTSKTCTTKTKMRYHCRCGFRCSIKPLLDSHINISNSKWKCDMCNERFMDKRFLDLHNVQNHNAANSADFAYSKQTVKGKHEVNPKSSKNRCSCGKAFVDKNLLQLHVASKGRL